MYALFITVLYALAILASTEGKFQNSNCSLKASMVATKSKGYSVFVFVVFLISRVSEPILHRLFEWASGWTWK